MAAHRHQSSLEGIINFSGPQPLAAATRTRALATFHHIVDHFIAKDGSRKNGYSRPLLLHYTYKYLRSELSQDTFLRAFFDSMALDLAGEDNVDFSNKAVEEGLGTKLTAFADFLLDNFFLPVKASGHRTPQPSPAHLSAVQRAQGGGHSFTGTPERISILRGSCLVRDRHRCVISRKFDRNEAMRRTKQDGGNAQDDYGNLLCPPYSFLEVAHILPHYLTQTDADNQLNDSKKAALMVLNIFDTDVSYIINGVDIDRPFNAITLTRDLHTLFGNFDIYFDAIPGQEHTYRIDTFQDSQLLDNDVPVTRTLYLADNGSIDPPSPRLLAIHRAIAFILHLSGAGEYIDNILRDMEDLGTQADGSTSLGPLVQLKMGGWLDGAVGV